MSASDMAALISKLTSLTNDIPKDEESRKKLFEATRSLNLALETAGETTQRICYLVIILDSFKSLGGIYSQPANHFWLTQ